MSALAVNTLAYMVSGRGPRGDNGCMKKRPLTTPLAALMRSRGISDNQLARALMIPQPTISRIASGKTTEPKEKTLRQIAGYFGVTTEELRSAYMPAGEPAAKYRRDELPTLAQDIARRWLALSPDRQEWFRDLIFTMAFMEERFPAMRKGRPKGESYAHLERAIEQDMKQLKLDIDP